MNNMHHPTDVIAGAIVGTIAQILNCLFVQRMLCCQSTYESIPSNSMNMNHMEAEADIDDSNRRN